MDKSAEYSAAISRLSTMSDELLALATEMRCIYPLLTIHRHLLAKAASLGEMPQWELDDLELYFTDDSPEPMLAARRSSMHREPPPRGLRASLPKAFLGRKICKGALCGLRFSATATFEVREGHTRVVRDGSATSEWVSPLGECADPRCATYRVQHPNVRRNFRDCVVSRMAARLGPGERLRYVTVGSGRLLYDLEILLALEEALGGTQEMGSGAGASGTGDGGEFGNSSSVDAGPVLENIPATRIASVVAIDKRYSFEADAILRLSDLLDPTTVVHAFGHVDSFCAMAERERATFGDAHCVIQADADDVDPEDTRRVAAAALRPGGLAFVLRGIDPDGKAKTLVREQRELNRPRAFGAVAESSESGELLWSP